MTKLLSLLTTLICTLLLLQCTQSAPPGADETGSETADQNYYGGFESQAKWGEHLVIIGACHDCHTPKKMTDHGPVLDSTLMLSGHPAQAPRIDINRAEIESKGLVTTGDLTEWIGPWGVSFTANLTPDPTGTGNWTEEQFIRALREGKYKGLADARPLLPPMPWEMYKHMTDDEIKAIFAYLKTVPPINNVVPPPVPPASAGTNG